MLLGYELNYDPPFWPHYQWLLLPLTKSIVSEIIVGKSNSSNSSVCYTTLEKCC